MSDFFPFTYRGIMRFLCGICQRPVDGAYIDVCADCQSEYGLNPRPFEEWPDWAKLAMRNEWRRRKSYARELDAEVKYGAYADLESLLDGLRI